MASSLISSELMSLMDHDVDEFFFSDPHLMESPIHVFPHNLPEYVVIDVDPTTVVNNLQDQSFFHPYLYENSSIHCNVIDEIRSDDSNAIHDSQSRYIPQFSPPRSIADYNPIANDNIGDILQLSPPLSISDDNPDQCLETFSRNCKKKKKVQADDVDQLNTSSNMDSTT
ncbi:hypothetical protein L1987_07024 [Smallanthus sonchifolius]|uniref:Uncharacterized protein n=1 Tax=Smallanthus sonchifolius TaxID=185202 RepID=A0ACB9JZV9_9ASTR|nr:hypothetical protein L1987_07024 [Smallanthus sonchifolius]